MMEHLDELTLWLYAVKRLTADQLAAAAAHLSDCLDCAESQLQISRLDTGLRELALVAGFPVADNPFEPSDPFRRRPAVTEHAHGKTRLSRAESAEALEATERAASRSEEIIESVKRGADPSSILAKLSIPDPTDRFTLLYVLQEAGRQSAANPIAIRAFAERALERIRRERGVPDAELAEGLVPRFMLRAHAHLLLAMALLWLKEFSRARRHLIVAYNSFARAGADDVSFALVENIESQRRSFSGEGRTGLLLARRARKTFSSYGMEDYTARATVSEGVAHWSLDEWEEAVTAYRSALPTFERQQLWSNYVGALNNAATCLIKLGRFDEARREYARALRRFSHEEHRYWLGYVRVGFAEALFAAGRFREAARAAAQAGSVFGEAGLRAHHLIAHLLEVESWARHGDLDRARGRLEVFRAEVERDHALDPAVQRELVAALSGTNPDYENISSLRRRVSDLLEERYRA
jgi:tetratricopeptide (TPR) repeat protein